MAIKSLLLATLILSVASISCKKSKQANKCVEEVASVEEIQGSWTHQYPEKREPNFTHPDQYNKIKFFDDSFLLTVTHRGDELFANGCHEVLWSEYARGSFVLSENNLTLKGIYTDSFFVTKTSGCYNIGAYADSFKTHFCNDTLVLYSLSKKNYTDNFRSASLLKD